MNPLILMGIVTIALIGTYLLQPATLVCETKLIGSEPHSYPYTCPSTWGGKTVKYCQYVNGGTRTVLPGSGSTITGTFRVDYYAEICPECPSGTAKCGQECIDTSFKCDKQYVYWHECLSGQKITRVYDCANPANTPSSASQKGAPYCSVCLALGCVAKERWWDKGAQYSQCEGNDGVTYTCLGSNQWDRKVTGPNACLVCKEGEVKCEGKCVDIRAKCEPYYFPQTYSTKMKWGECISDKVQWSYSDCPGGCKELRPGSVECKEQKLPPTCGLESSKCGSLTLVTCCPGLYCKGETTLVPGICVNSTANCLPAGKQCKGDSDCCSRSCDKGLVKLGPFSTGPEKPFGTCAGFEVPGWLIWLAPIGVVGITLFVTRNLKRALIFGLVAFLVIYFLANIIWLIVILAVLIALYIFVPPFRFIINRLIM